MWHLNGLKHFFRDIINFGHFNFYIRISGGTVDVTVHEVLQGNRLRELHAATGGNWGGVEVNKAFCNFVSQLAGPDNFQNYSSENKAEYLEFLEDFEEKKRTANPKSADTVRIKVVSTLFNILLANKSNFQNIKGRIRLLAGKLILEADHFRSFFETPIKDILNHVEDLVELVPGKLDTILLVGGFAESPILQKAVEDQFNERFNVIIPLNASMCVLKGAVLYGLNPISVAYRVSRYTYGVSTSMRFQEGVHPPERRSEGSKEAFCDGIFDVHVKINQEVPTNKAATERTYYPITNDDKLLHITLYRSSKEDPKFVDEEDCKPVGTMEIKVDTSVGKTSKDRPVKVKMIFGGSDIKVLAQQNNGKPPREADFKLNGMF